MLRSRTGYISGQELCDTLGVSRTAVWKVINQLKEEGYQIEAVRNKGYHLLEAPDILNAEEIESLMGTQWAGRQIAYFPVLDSTNIQAKRMADEGYVHGTLIVADCQNAGKGRRGKNWSSPSGTGIWMSLLLKPEMEPNKAPMLTLVMAYSVACAIREKAKLDVKIKWPNDLIIDKKKICGILTEMNAEVDYVHHVVIGVGINVNTEEFPEELEDLATSLRLEKGGLIRRAELIASIMEQFEVYYEQFIKTGNIAFLQTNYNQLLVNQDREVRVLGVHHSYEGIALGINETGELLVRTQDGTIQNVFAGEVSVRGIYGYV